MICRREMYDMASILHVSYGKVVYFNPMGHVNFKEKYSKKNVQKNLKNFRKCFLIIFSSMKFWVMMFFICNFRVQSHVVTASQLVASDGDVSQLPN